MMTNYLSDEHCLYYPDGIYRYHSSDYIKISKCVWCNEIIAYVNGKNDDRNKWIHTMTSNVLCCNGISAASPGD